MELWETWLLSAAALHLGFQATVTLLVYPALVAHGRDGGDWAVVHAAHSRRITPLVVLVYGALLPPVLVNAWQVAGGEAGWGAGLAVTGAVLAFATTGLVAAPAHGRLSRGWHPSTGLRLVRADVVRLVGAVICLAGAMAVAA